MKRTISIVIALLIGLRLNAQDDPDNQFMNAYIVVADTSQDYSKLNQRMFELSEKLPAEIDTMGRTYNETKNLICLPENDEDEIYAGEYFPRRYPSESLSLEYLRYYSDDNQAIGKSIAIVVMITDDKEAAEKKLVELKKHSQVAFIVNTEIYMGCMH